MKTKNIIFALIVVVISFMTACSDNFFDVKTTDSLTIDDATRAMEADPSKLSGFVDAIYNVLIKYDLVTDDHDSFGLMSILHSTDMMSEDIVMSKLSWFMYDYKHDNREWNYRRTRTDWTYLYTVISSANNVLGMTNPETTSDQIKAYRGQVLALRGMAYFYLIQLYQHTYPVSAIGDRPGVPILYARNEGKTSIRGRATVDQVMKQIESDLTVAVQNLSGYTRSTKNQINEQVAQGLLARYYLLTEQWSKAVTAARAARTGYSIMPSSQLTDGFMDVTNSECMWGYDQNSETTTLYASFFSHISNLTPGYAGLEYAPRLIDKRLYESIPATDARKDLFQNPEGSIDAGSRGHIASTAWKIPYANLKFGWDGMFTMDYIYMRASEMVLIEAEALTRSGNTTEAATVLKELMEKRDPSWNQTTVTLNDVWMQRRIELWGEGFSYFDLKRLNKGINRNYDGSNHEASAKLVVSSGDKRWIYQIPEAEIQENEFISEEDNNE